MRTLLLLLLLLNLVACVKKPIKVKANDPYYTGMVTTSIEFSAKQQRHQWICYSEIIAQRINGLSCQNDTALQLFSGGRVGQSFEFSYPSRYLLKIQPNHVLSYLKMALFKNLSYSPKDMHIKKTAQQTEIKDLKNNRELTIKVL